MRAFIVSAGLVVLSACKVVVLGDSNSCLWRSGCAVAGNSDWPLFMTQRTDWPGWTVVNRALPSMLAGTYAGDGTLANGEPANGTWQLDRLIGEGLGASCEVVVRDKLVIALGTNDVAHAGVGGADAGRAVVALYDRARASAPCVDVYVATIPPRLGVRPSAVRAANRVIRRHVPAGRIIPFGTEGASDLDPSGVHMTVAGQHRRADLAFAVLFPRARRTPRRRARHPVLIAHGAPHGDG